MNKNNRKEKKDNLNSLKFIGPGLLVTVGFIDVLLMFDIEYVPCKDDTFTSSYVGNTNVDFGKIVNANIPPISIKGCDPTVLGKKKSNPWEYEKETRILCALSGNQNPGWEYIDLRLKPEIFRGLTIILSPWDEGNLRKDVENIINASKLPEDINVVDSLN